MSTLCDNSFVIGKKTKARYHHGDLRAALIQCGLELIERDGIHALTFREIGKQLGVSRSAAYRHFKDKEALLSAIYEAGANGLNGASLCPFCGQTSSPIRSDVSGF
jgi:AcrR family transcriptional regulator